MEKMKLDAPLDYAVFQLSPKRSRCELFASSGGSTEKLASGLLKPFIVHLKVAEEQVASAAQSVKLEVGRSQNTELWFTKGTLERFVRFVSTPEVLELVNTFDAEMSQLEAARKIYSQGAGDQLSGGGGPAVTAADDATKKELLRAIDLRLGAVQQDLSTACARAAAAGFNVDTVPDLQMFAHRFGAHRLNEACCKFISLCEKRPNLVNQWKPVPEDRTLRSSCGSDMSIDDDVSSSPPPRQESGTCQPPNDAGNKSDDAVAEKDGKDETPTPDQTGSIQASQPARRLSVQDRINMFESKQKESSGGKPVVAAKPVELRRLSSDVSTMGAAAEKAVLRRWSGISDMSIDLSVEKKDSESPLCTTPSSATVSQENKTLNLNDAAGKEIKIIPSSNRVSDRKSEEILESDGLTDKILGRTQSRSFVSTSDNQENSEEKFKNLLKEKLKGSQSSENLSGPHSQIDIPSQRGTSESKDEPVTQKTLKSTRKTGGESGLSEGVSGSRIREAFAARYKGVEGDSSYTQQRLRSVGENELDEKKELNTSEKVSSVSGIEDSGLQRMKFNRQGLAAELSKKAKFQRDEGFDSFSTPPPEPVQRVRQSKGNQGLNDELKLKANELEKLFAEHKLRAPGDQSNSAREGKLEDTQRETASSVHHSKQQIPDVLSSHLSDNYKLNEPKGSFKNKTKFTKMIDSQNYGDALNRSFSELNVSEGSRGKLYDKYLQKRDAKLREDWSSNRAEKEARLKSMQDSLERNRSEMKAKFSGEDSVSTARRRAERLRSYNSRSIMKREQQYLDFGDSEDDEEALAFDDLSLGDGVSRVPQGKKLSPNNRNLSSSTPRTSAASVPRSATKTSSNPGKRRLQAENPLTQSVPNFSELRKENTKPSFGGSKTTRSQVRNYARSKSTTEEDKSRRSQALRKSSANPSDFKDIPPLDSAGVVLTPLKFDEEVLKNVGSTKPFLKKGSRARSSIARQRAVSLDPEPINNVDENDETASLHDGAEFETTVKDEGDEELETLNAVVPKILEDEDQIVNSESENGDSENLNFSRVDQALGSQLPIDSLQDWPNESPVSWNARSQHPFLYPQETSDVDASVDSPVGSPASWNSNSLNQMESDAARMRKKWGTAQKPMLAAHSSNNSTSRSKDMTRGFKRLLKFGRKNRGSESLVDWISATTSEGDDDTEDGRDPANRSSDDLRKSRMGFSHALPSDDGFNESEFFNESVQSSHSSIPAPPANFKLREDHISGSSIKAPRSFFSLSTFRSKGSETKPR